MCMAVLPLNSTMIIDNAVLRLAVRSKSDAASPAILYVCMPLTCCQLLTALPPDALGNSHSSVIAVAALHTFMFLDICTACQPAYT